MADHRDDRPTDDLDLDVLTRSPTLGIPAGGMRNASSTPTPGTLIGDRYLVVSLLGRGGMGEVYLAEDLRLGQKVALKFLPGHARRTGEELDALLREVRIGRQIAHPNVCRLYDFVEIGEQQFVSMEHVDGEDLASLLGRVDRLPYERALAIAKDICAGLESIHQSGVLHRDLKPGNILIDARGHAHITDFGIARRTDEGTGDGLLVGTPAYMAPELFRREPPTRQSDIYALGIILYQLFAGKLPLDATLPALLAQSETVKTIQPPSHSAPDIDPAVDRIILQCLASDPSRRPATAHLVGASLPGADPLQIALAAGETPSRAMVAEAETFRGFRARAIVALALGVLAGILLISTLAQRSMLYNRAVVLPRAQLLQRAQTILRLAAPHVDAPHIATWFDYDGTESLALRERRLGGKLDTLSHSPIRFHYRVSPKPLVPKYRFSSDQPPALRIDDPPHELPGMASIVLDSRGNLRELRVVAPQSPTDASGLRNVLAATGFDWTRLTPSTSDKAVPVTVPSDRHFFWTGSTAEGLPLSVSAATYRGAPVWLSTTIGERDIDETPSEIWSEIVQIVAILVAAIAAALLTRRNIRRGRGDRIGAFRFAAVVFVSWVFAWIAGTPYRRTIIGQWWVFAEAISQALFWSGMMWLAYVALEPIVRRHWPQTLVGWTRLFDGRFRDPLVGRDVIVGVATGVFLALLRHLLVVLPPLAGVADTFPSSTGISELSGPGAAASTFFFRIHTALFNAVGCVITFLVLRLFVRRFVVAAALWIPLIVIINFGGRTDPVSLALLTLFTITMLLVLNRFGLLSLAVALFVNFNLRGVTITPPVTEYEIPAVVTTTVLSLLFAWGAAIALQRRATVAVD